MTFSGNRGKAALIVALTLVAGCLFWVLLDQRSGSYGKPTLDVTRPVEGLDGAPSVANGVAGGYAGTRPTVLAVFDSDSGHSPRHLLERARTAASASQALDILGPLVRTDNATAIRLEQALIGRCWAFRDGPERWPAATAPAGSADNALQTQAIRRLGTYCGTDARLGDLIDRTGTRAREAIARLARDGDENARALALGDSLIEVEPGQLLAQAQQLLAFDLEPEARLSLLRRLVTADESQSPLIGIDLFNHALIDPQRESDLRVMAAEIYLCRRERRCDGFHQFAVDEVCIMTGNCAAGLPLDRFLLTRIANAQEAALVERLAEEIAAFP